MKLQKHKDKAKGVDTYTLSIKYDEADAAFKLMTPLEKGMIHDLQKARKISTILKVLTIWTQRIEEAMGDRDDTTYEG